MAKKLTASVVVDVGNCEIPIAELSENQLEQFKKNCSSRLTRVMSNYFSQHPEELRAISSY